jgi:hypothetical protein
LLIKNGQNSKIIETKKHLLDGVYFIE